MGMSLGGRGTKSEINMTPMIDVLLVLIIIFMVIAPTDTVGLRALVPQSAPATAAPEPERHDIVVSVYANGRVALNQEEMSLAELKKRLDILFRNTGNAVIFVRGDKGLLYQEVAVVIDLARGAGVNRIGLMTN